MIAQAGRPHARTRAGLTLAAVLVASSVLAAAPAQAGSFAPVCPDVASMGPLSGEADFLSLPCSDGDGDRLSAVIVVQPTNGTVDVVPASLEDGNDEIRYISAPGFTGSDTFTFQATDETHTSENVVVSVTVTQNTPPVCGVQTPQDVVAGRVEALSFVCTDEDDDELSFAVDGDPDHGTIDHDDEGNVLYVADADYSGPDEVSFSASDGYANASGVLPIVVLAPEPPSCGDGPLERMVQTGGTIDLQLTCENPQNDPQSYEIPDEPSLGDVLPFDSDGSSTYTAGTTAGTDTFTVEVTNLEGTTPKEVVVTVTEPPNQAPVCTANASNPRSVNRGVATELDLTTRCTDSDGDPLEFVRVSSPVSGASLSAGPAPTLTYTSPMSFAGSDTFTYQAIDDRGGTSATTTYHLSVANEAPTCAPANVSTAVGTDVTIMLSCTDQDDDELTLEVAEGPDHGVLGPIVDGQVTYTPESGFDGADSFTYLANDGVADSAPVTVDISVTVDEPPVDEEPPVVRLTVPGRQTPAGVARAGLKVTTRINEVARSTVKLSVSKAVARKLKIDPRAKRAVVIGTVPKTLQPGSTALKVRLTKRASTAFKKVRSVSVLVVFRAVDVGGNAAQVQRSVTLRR